MGKRCLTRAPIRAPGKHRDPQRGIHDSNANLLGNTRNDDRGTGRNRQLFFTPKTDGARCIAALSRIEPEGFARLTRLGNLSRLECAAARPETVDRIQDIKYLPDYAQSSGWGRRFPGSAGFQPAGGPCGLEARAPGRPTVPRSRRSRDSRAPNLSFVRNQEFLDKIFPEIREYRTA